MKHFIKTLFKWFGVIIILLLPIFLFVLMVTIQESRIHFTQKIHEMTDKLPAEPLSLPNGKPLPTVTNNSLRPIRVLVMNGGGIHGLAQLKVLNYLEKQSGKSVSQLFDVVGCTSTGCLNLGTLLTPNKQQPTQPAYSAQQLINDYQSFASTIFFKSWYHQVASLGGLTKPIYSSKLKGLLLSNVIGTAKLNQLLLPSYICTTAYHNLRNICFASWRDDMSQYAAANVINAASSPPAFFTPVAVTKNAAMKEHFMNVRHDLNLDNAYMDGVVVTNDPSLQLMVYILSKYPRNPIVFVRIGCAIPNYSLDNNAITWAPIQWVMHALDVLYQARESHLADGLQYLMTLHQPEISYYDIDTDEPNDIPVLSSDPVAITAMGALANKMVQENKSKLDALIPLLTTHVND